MYINYIARSWRNRSSLVYYPLNTAKDISQDMQRNTCHSYYFWHVKDIQRFYYLLLLQVQRHRETSYRFDVRRKKSDNESVVVETWRTTWKYCRIDDRILYKIQKHIYIYIYITLWPDRLLSFLGIFALSYKIILRI